MEHKSGMQGRIGLPAVASGLILAMAHPSAGCIPGGPRGEEGVPECDLDPAPAFFAVAFPEDDIPSHLTTFAGEVVALGEDTCTSRQEGYQVVMGDEQSERPGSSITLTIDDGSSCGTLTLYIAGLPVAVALGDFVEVQAVQLPGYFELELRKDGELLGFMVSAGGFPEELDVPPEIEVTSGDPSCDRSDTLLRQLHAARNGQTVDVAPSSFAELEGFIVVHRWTSEYVGDAVVLDAPRTRSSFAFVRK